MIHFVTYDATGRITGRIKSSDGKIVEHYERHIVVSEAEYNAEPEIDSKVDLETKKLVKKS